MSSTRTSGGRPLADQACLQPGAPQSGSYPAAQVTIKSGQTLIKYLQTHSYAASESSSIIACHAQTLLSPDTEHIFLFFFPGLDWGHLSSAFLNYKIGARNVPRGTSNNPCLVHY